MSDSVTVRMNPAGTGGGAVFSGDERHRLLLFRVLDPTLFTVQPPYPLFVMLNPSAATADVDDPTIRRCAGFTRRLGYASFHVCNLFSLRATDPAALCDRGAEGDPVNLAIIVAAAAKADAVICAWGNHGHIRQRAAIVCRALLVARHGNKLRCFGRTMSGAPRHPLYLSKDTELVPFSGWEARFTESGA